MKEFLLDIRNGLLLTCVLATLGGLVVITMKAAEALGGLVAVGVLATLTIATIFFWALGAFWRLSR